LLYGVFTTVGISFGASVEDTEFHSGIARPFSMRCLDHLGQQIAGM
jgi:hypothetical protein